MNPEAQAYRTYLWLLLLPVAAFAVMIGISLLFLYRGGELAELTAIAALQQREGGLYGTALHDDTYSYKLALASVRKPVVAVLGSSRVLTISQKFFVAPMVNLGLMASSAQQMEVAVQDLIRQSRPAVVVLGIDFFWASPKWIGPLDLSNPGLDGRTVTPNKLFAPVLWLSDGRVSGSAFWASLIGAPPKLLALPSHGWMARLQGNGYAADGEWIYGGTIYGRQLSDDIGFSSTLSRVSGGTAQFVHSTNVDPAAIAAIRRTILALGQAGIPAVTVLPPLAPSVLAAIRARPAEFAYIDQFKVALREVSPQHLDLLDIESIGGTDCEFVDGFHAGEVANARLLLALGSTQLYQYLDHRKLREVVRQNAGNVLVDRIYARPEEAEVDFLVLGCQKNVGMRTSGPQEH